MSPLSWIWLLSVRAALAGGDPALAGTWTLDLAASESMDELLAARGASWTERQAAASIPITREIALDGELVSITTRALGRERTQLLIVDGQPRLQESDRGAGESLHRWGADGALITEGGGVDGQGRTTRAVTTWRLQEDALHQEIALWIDDSRWSATRVFRRAE